jgi:light-regulated signal transduction histidine kinase (bacteriophytochrome)
MVSDVVETFQLISETHKIILRGKTLKKLTGDKERLEQVIINLISNAIKYSPGSKKVVVKIKNEAKNLSIVFKILILESQRSANMGGFANKLQCGISRPRQKLGPTRKCTDDG